MSVYKNPKNGSTLAQMPKIASNIQMIDAPQEEYVTQEELVEGLDTKSKVEANPTLIGTETELQSLTIDGIKYKFPSRPVAEGQQI